MCIEKNKCSLYNTEVQPSLLDMDNVLNKLQFIAINYVPITTNNKKLCSSTLYVRCMKIFKEMYDNLII